MSDASLEAAFHLLVVLILPQWMLMLLAPGRSLTHRMLASPWSVVPPAMAYAVIVLPQLGELLPLLLRPTPDALADYFSHPGGFMAIWSHAIALDLFVGRWVYLDAYAARRSAWVMTPTLLMVLMLAPLGLLLYLTLRAAHSRARRA